MLKTSPKNTMDSPSPALPSPDEYRSRTDTIPQTYIVPEALKRQIESGICWVCGHNDSPLDVWAICAKCRERTERGLAQLRKRLG